MTASNDSSAEPRRDFLRRGVQLGALAAAAALAGSAPACALFLKQAKPDATLAPAPEGDRVRVPAGLLPWNTGRPALVIAVTGRDGKLLLFRTADGETLALDMTCTHLGCDVGLDLPDRKLVCPCHGSEYDLHGGNLKGPADEPLAQHAVTQDGADVLIAL